MMKSIEEAIQQTREAYAPTARLYAELARPFNEHVMYPTLMRLTQELLGELKRKRILDIGCGAGALMAKLEAAEASAYGIDVTPEFVMLARARGLKRVIEGSMHDMPFADHAFHAVVSNFALPYLPPEGQILTREKFITKIPKEKIRPAAFRSGRPAPLPVFLD